MSQTAQEYVGDKTVTPSYSPVLQGRTVQAFLSIYIKGGPKKPNKNAPQFLRNFLATNMQEGWDIINWKGGIHSFV